MKQGVVRGEQAIGGWAKGGRVLEGEGWGNRGEGAAREGGWVLIGREC